MATGKEIWVRHILASCEPFADQVLVHEPTRRDTVTVLHYEPAPGSREPAEIAVFWDASGLAHRNSPAESAAGQSSATK